MSKKLKKDFENLAEIIRHHSDGLSIKELLALIGDGIPKRTVQYRLSVLVKFGILKIEGSGRNTKYHCNEPGEITQVVQSSGRIKTMFTIPLSTEGEEVRRRISVPIQLRPHVSYRREFLDSYEPNKTFYFSILF